MKKKIKKVMIALDYDPTAQKVVETGYQFAEAMGAEVTLLHVVSDPVYYSTTAYSPIMGFNGYMNLDPMQVDTIDGLKNASLNYLNNTKKHLNDESIQVRVEEGDIAATILETAATLNADAIVIGTHSRKWLEKILMGSVAEEVLSQTSITLFIIPTKKH